MLLTFSSQAGNYLVARLVDEFENSHGCSHSTPTRVKRKEIKRERESRFFKTIQDIWRIGGGKESESFQEYQYCDSFSDLNLDFIFMIKNALSIDINMFIVFNFLVDFYLSNQPMLLMKIREKLCKSLLWISFQTFSPLF